MMKTYVPQPLYSSPPFVSGSKPQGFIQEPYDDMYHFSGERKRIVKKKEGNKASGVYELKDYHRQVEAIYFENYKQFPVFETRLKFYKFLAKRPDLKQNNSQHQRKLQVWIPDTIVYNDMGSGAFWVYTGEDGFVHKTENFQDKHVVSKLGDQYHLDEIAAIIKISDFDERNKPTTEIEFLNSRDLAERVPTCFGRGAIIAIQKFIKCKGPQPFIVRSVWRKDKPCYSWIISGKHKFQDPECKSEQEKFSCNPRNLFSCSIIQSRTGRTVYETNKYIENLVKFLEPNIRLFFEEMVCDFIKDESGLWWMIGVRAYKFTNPEIKPNLKLFIEDYEEPEEGEKKNKEEDKALEKRLQVCRMCQLGYAIHELSQRMTLKMIITTETQLKSLGIRRSWLDHGELDYYDLHTLYESRRVCNQCFALYKQVRELNKVAIKFSKVLGIPIDNKNETYMNLMLKEKYGIELDENKNKGDKDATDMLNYEIPATKKKEDEEILQIEKLHRFKFLFILYDLIEFNIIPEQYDYYYLVYNMMGEKVKFKLSTKRTFKAGVPIVPINKIRLHYFFSDEREGLLKFINHGPQVVKLYHKNELISKVLLEIKDFRSPSVNQKSFYSALIGKTMNCYLRCMIGIEMDTPEAINVNSIKLTKYRGIYLPPRDYMSCQPLTEEWVPRIPNLYKYNEELSKLIVESK